MSLNSVTFYSLMLEPEFSELLECAIYMGRLASSMTGVILEVSITHSTDLPKDQRKQVKLLARAKSPLSMLKAGNQIIIIFIIIILIILIIYHVCFRLSWSVIANYKMCTPTPTCWGPHTPLHNIQNVLNAKYTK